MVITWVLGILAAVLLVPAAVLFAQVLAALLPARRAGDDSGDRPRIAVLVPAHDERLGIAQTVRNLLPHLGPGDRLLVVADNCSDDTAQLAAAAGAEVIERSDPDRRGKGYALDFGLRHLSANPPEVVVIVDADCEVVLGSLERLARVALAHQRPAQAHYRMRAARHAGAGRQIASFAWLVKNLVRPVGMARLGLPCQLMGTGMAFAWPLIAQQELASAEIVEDLKLGLDCAVSGSPALFVPDVTVESTFPDRDDGLRVQRSRWEHGHLSAILTQFPRTLWIGLRHRSIDLVAIALDLAVPPLALLLMLVCAAKVLAGGWWLTSGVALPLWLTLMAGLLLAAAVLMAWHGFGRQTISMRTLAMAPVYALGKLHVYVAFVRRRQREWVRTHRDSD